MDDPGDRAEINQTVQRLPAPSTQPADPACGGSDRQWNQQHQRNKPNRDVLAFDDIREDLMNIKKLIHPKVRREV